MLAEPSNPETKKQMKTAEQIVALICFGIPLIITVCGYYGYTTLAKVIGSVVAISTIVSIVLMAIFAKLQCDKCSQQLFFFCPDHGYHK